MPPKKVRSESGRSLVPSRERSTRSRAALRKTRIVNMPVELVRAIFITYYELTQAPILLLLVCRQWRDIALGVSSLWNTIRFQPWRKQFITPTIKMAMHMPVTCLGWGNLKFAASRAADGMLSISCDLDQFDLIVATNSEAWRWLSPKCRQLRINYGRGQAQIFVDAFRNLANLVEMSLNCTYPYSDFDLDIFLEKVETSSHQLTSLEISGPFGDSLLARPALLGRLRRLDIYPIDLFNPITDPNRILHHVGDLEELLWHGNVMPDLSHISDNLLSLTIEACTALPSFSFGRLESLTITTQVNGGLPTCDAVEFPVLKHLHFSGSWEESTIIKAPELDLMDLWCTDGHELELPLAPTKVQPRGLAVKGIPGTILVELLRGMWSKIHALTWNYHPYEPVPLDRLLVSALAGTRNVELLCPLLKSFDMRTKPPDSMLRSDKEELEAQLRRIMRGRQRRGCELRGLCWHWTAPDNLSRLLEGYWFPEEEGIQFL